MTKNKVIIVVTFKNEESECFVADSYLIDSHLLTLIQGDIKCTLRLDLIKVIYKL